MRNLLLLNLIKYKNQFSQLNENTIKSKLNSNLMAPMFSAQLAAYCSASQVLVPANFTTKQKK